MGALIWFIGALILAGLELLAGEFTLLMLATAALATAGVALVEVPMWVEAATFGASSLILLFFLRPVLRRHLSRPGALDTSPQALIGKSAEVLEVIDKNSGQVRLDGSIWSARPLDPHATFAVGEQVNVAHIDGPTAIVWKD